MRIFISHSETDTNIATALIDLLETALPLSDGDIRCTSVPGYRLPGGAHIDGTLQSEVTEADLMIAVLTPEALKSIYVIFELGARWGSKKPLIPLLASGVRPEDLNDPIRRINALDGHEYDHLTQLVRDAAKYLNVRERKGSFALELRALSSEIYRFVSEGISEDMRDGTIRDWFSKLSVDAQYVIREAVDRGSSSITMHEEGQAIQLYIGDTPLIDKQIPRSEERWRAAFSELLGTGLVVRPWNDDGAFGLTQEAVRIAEALKQP